MIIGIAGGGQLGRMLTDAAHVLGHKTVVLDPTPNSPALQVADVQMLGDYKDESKMLELSSNCDVLTYEIESVNAVALEKIAQSGKPVHPAPKTLSYIKDKLTQKGFLAARSIPTADFVEVINEKTARDAGELLGYPFILKARSGGFDGRGNKTIEKESDIAAALEALGSQVYAERVVAFDKELAVVAARNATGEIAIYPVVETIHKDHICHMTLVPADISKNIAENATHLAHKVLKNLEGVGIMGIEMFLQGDHVLINEIAPRVHNSGHWTIEGVETNQFEQHIRAITGAPLGPVTLKSPATVMINILGERDAAAEPAGIMNAEQIPGVKVHIYGKMETRMKRKMGHLTAVAESL